MLQISNLKLFFKTKTNQFPFPFKPYFLSNPKTLHKPLSILTKTTISSSSRKQPPKFHSLRTRNNSTFSKNRKEMPSESMEEVKEEGTSVVGFNKRRAEGKDKNDKPKKNLQLKTRKLNPVSTTSYVQILGTGMDTQDTSPSVLLFFDKQRFIFNAGEGLQRYCTEHKIKLSKVDHILLSRVCSETAGGLPGLLLTLAGMGEEGMSVKIWGSSDLQHLITAMRSFIPHSAMFHTGIVGQTPTEPFIDNEVVKIYAILIRPSSSVQSDDSSMLHFSSVGLSDERNRFSEPLFPPASPARIDGSMVKPGDISVIYVCELPEIQGKFDLEKAKALGLKPGPKYRDLQCGKSVKSDKQNIMVHPGDVLGPSVPGPIVLVVDCPTVSHLQELLSVQSLSCYYADSVDHRQHDFKCVNCIIHLSPSSVTMTAAYQNWMKRFGRAQHIMAGHEEKNTEIPILKSSARTAARLNYLCPQFFPASGFWSLQHLKNFAPDLIEDSIPKLCDSISGENLIKFHLRPYTHLGLDKSSIPASISSTAVINELLSEIPDIVHSAKEISQLWVGLAESERAKPHTPESVVMTEEPWISADASVPNIIIDEKIGNASTEIISCPPSCLEDITREDMEIVLLGTGSSQPSKYRNVSSIYINLFSKGSLLLDCGEGTLGQLKRRFGVKGADDAIRSLRCVWISHIHADHHTGLARILSLRRELLSGDSHEPLLVIGPRQLKSFLDAYQRLEDLDMQFVDCSETTEAKLASFERSFELGDSSPSGSPVGTGSTLNIEKSLFARGSPMQSYRKRPTSPVDTKILKNLKKVLAEAGLEALISIPVVHCPYAYGIVVKAAERTNRAGKTIPGWKLVYSGDTRPCPELIEASRGATVLIHEATFEDGMVDEAIARNHSTTGEAIDVGNSADVYRIILTHFSQRYPKIPVFDEAHMHKTCIAFDLMSVNVADLPVLPKVVPYFKHLFRDEMISDEVDDFLGPLL